MTKPEPSEAIRGPSAPGRALVAEKVPEHFVKRAAGRILRRFGRGLCGRRRSLRRDIDDDAARTSRQPGKQFGKRRLQRRGPVRRRSALRRRGRSRRSLRRDGSWSRWGWGRWGVSRSRARRRWRVGRLGSARCDDRRRHGQYEQCQRGGNDGAMPAENPHPCSPSRRLRSMRCGTMWRARRSGPGSGAGLFGTVDMKWHRKWQGPIG